MSVEARIAIVAGGFVRAFGNSLTIALINVALALAIGTPAAFALTRMRGRIRNDLSFWVLSIRMAPRAGSTTTNGGTDFRLTPLTGRSRSDSDGATPRSHGEDESTGSARHSGVGSGSSKATDGSWKAKKPGAASGSM